VYVTLTPASPAQACLCVRLAHPCPVAHLLCKRPVLLVVLEHLGKGPAAHPLGQRFQRPARHSELPHVLLESPFDQNAHPRFAATVRPALTLLHLLLSSKGAEDHAALVAIEVRTRTRARALSLSFSPPPPPPPRAKVIAFVYTCV
jgi:hypothetical protein